MATSTTYGNAAAGLDVGAAIVRDATDRPHGPGPDVMDAGSLKGDKVVNAGGDELGKIEAIMLDVTSGRIAYAVLAFGGSLSSGSKLFAIPWSALTLDAIHRRFVLDATKERLESAPGFDKDHWPSMADRAWATDVHDFYEANPYWDDTLSASSG